MAPGHLVIWSPLSTCRILCTLPFHSFLRADARSDVQFLFRKQIWNLPWQIDATRHESVRWCFNLETDKGTFKKHFISILAGGGLTTSVSPETGRHPFLRCMGRTHRTQRRQTQSCSTRNHIYIVCTEEQDKTRQTMGTCVSNFVFFWFLLFNFANLFSFYIYIFCFCFFLLSWITKGILIVFWR